MGGVFSGGIFSLLLWGIIVFILVYLAIRLFGSLRSRQTGQDRDRHDSLDILKVRYARGELSQDDYARMKEILLQT